MTVRALCATAAVMVALAGCGASKASVPPAPSTRTPLTVSAPVRLCPASDNDPGRVLSKSAGDVMVPGHPTSAIVCRYWGHKLGLPPGRRSLGELGHAEGTLAEARRISREDVTAYLAAELDTLPRIGPHPNCDELLGGRSELFLFRYPRDGFRYPGEARVLITYAACVPVENGRIVRGALGSLHGNGELHWVDEGLL